jgi:SAM-dependent methyltransferase
VIDAFASMSAADAERFMADKFNAPLRMGVAALVNGRTLCDVGCGKAFMVDYLYQKDRYIGVDVSPQLLSIARANNPGYEFWLRDVAKSRILVNDASARRFCTTPPKRTFHGFSPISTNLQAGSSSPVPT